jgi:hypothetical protein
VEEAGSSHSSSVGSGSEAGGSDANTGNRAGAGGVRIRVDRAEPRASRRKQASGRLDANAADTEKHLGKSSLMVSAAELPIITSRSPHASHEATQHEKRRQKTVMSWVLFTE